MLAPETEDRVCNRAPSPDCEEVIIPPDVPVFLDLEHKGRSLDERADNQLAVETYLSDVRPSLRPLALVKLSAVCAEVLERDTVPRPDVVVSQLFSVPLD